MDNGFLYFFFPRWCDTTAGTRTEAGQREHLLEFVGVSVSVGFRCEVR